MNQLPSMAEPVASRPATCQRSDVDRRVIIDQAIALQAHSSTMSAIEYLKAHRIDCHLITRVLLEPERRRMNGQ